MIKEPYGYRFGEFRMNTSMFFKTGMIAATLIFSASASAGEAKVQWQNPESYSDIRSGNQTNKSRMRSIDNALGKEFTELAAKLPEGYRFEVTVTDLDLAGEIDPIPTRSMNQIRVLKDIYFPRMTLDYRLLDANGAVQMEQKDVKLKDMQYLSETNSVDSNQSYYSERKMIRDWFDKDILPKVK
jgi:hypothetical protein